MGASGPSNVHEMVGADMSDLGILHRASGGSKGGDHSLFDPKKSSTFKKAQGQEWKIQYGDGSSASGDVGTDVVTIGGLKIENQSIELAKTPGSAILRGDRRRPSGARLALHQHHHLRRLPGPAAHSGCQ